ncbi:MAG: formate/nitrite transporter family protein [Candidatus Nanopelagicales bacterium]
MAPQAANQEAVVVVETQKLFPGKAFISTVLEMLEYKSDMSGMLKQRYLMRAAMAGIIVGLMYVGQYSIDAGMEQIQVGEGTLLPVGKLLAATFFGFALVFIYYSKSELLTSNMMIMSIGHYYHRVRLRNSARVLALCYVGNLLGGLLIALLVNLSTIISPAASEIMGHSVEAKLAYVSEGATGWVDLLVRAIFCNFFINLAMLMVYNGNIHDDIVKSLIMIVSVFTFAYLGLEHSVANTVLFTIYGIGHGINVGLAVGNVILALIGNFVGGGILIGIYYAYVNDETRARRQHPEWA